jgi:glycosyltransferase involved in cell wall biosynthesis
MSISVVTIIKNGVDQGYCFIDSLLSCLPFADELIISDGYSKDGTYDYLLKFKKKYESKLPILLYQNEWPKVSYHGESIATISNEAIKRSKCNYTVYLQSDEVWYGDSINYVRNVDKEGKYNSVMFKFHHFIESWEPSKNVAYKEAIRMVKNNQNIYLKGDGFTFDGNIEPMCPATCPKPIAHFAWVFPKSNNIKHIEHAKLYQNFPEYQEKMKKALKNQEQKAYPLTSFNDFPKLAKRFVGKAYYKIPDLS